MDLLVIHKTIKSLYVLVLATATLQKEQGQFLKS